jgi:DNA-binding NtrC family response regulator
MQAIRADVEHAARSSAKVLLTGESGVGKEIVARLIHEYSPRAHTPRRSVLSTEPDQHQNSTAARAAR